MAHDQKGCLDLQAKSPLGEDLKMKTQGVMCLHPNDPQRFVFLTVSERTPVSRDFRALSPLRDSLVDTLKFERLQ